MAVNDWFLDLYEVKTGETLNVWLPDTTTVKKL